MALSRIKGIYFDLGYTLIGYGNRKWSLIDSEGQKLAYDDLINRKYDLPDFETFNQRLEFLKEQCRPADREALREWKATDAPEKLLADLNIENPVENSRRFIELTYSVARKYMSICEGGKETLRELKIRGYKIGIISNTLYSKDIVDTDLQLLGLDSFIEYRIYSSEIGYRKPHPRIFQAAVDRMQLQPHEIIYVGDRLRVDMLGAGNAGLQPVLLLREDMVYPDQIPPDIIVIKEISHLLDALDGAVRN
jgi:putative hydrolase of the HAD superfamily